jgi:nucleolar protein 58
MLILFETPAGFALFKLQDEGKLDQVDKLYEYFSDLSSAKRLITLDSFKKFSDTAEALESATAVIEGQVDKSLEDFIRDSIIQKDIGQRLAVADRNLVVALKEKFPDLDCVYEGPVKELYRCIRLHSADLLSMENLDLNAMTLGLSHSLGRYKLKFSPDKVDVMIVQAISLLDDLEKEINTYSMRIKEWYGWHFPELVRVIPDNLTYAAVVKRLGNRLNFETVDLTDLIGEHLAEMVKKVAKISMGTEISEEDIGYIIELCTQTIDIFEYKDELYEYLKSRMETIAPNLTVLVGELVGARLIAHAGSLINLAKHPASTVQILGAEKALFRAIKAKKATPKYGVIYNASFVGKSSTKNKGKASRILANKAALSCRVDALGNENTLQIGKLSLEKITSRLQELDVAPRKAKEQTPQEQDKKRRRSNGDDTQSKKQKY